MVFKRAFHAEVAETLSDAEATLTGRLLERHGWGADVPGWVVVNALAHGEWDWLSTLSEGTGGGRGRPHNAVVSFLAGETLATAGSREALAALQRRHLVPLELSLLDGAATARLSAAAAVTAVRAALARARARRRHPSSPGPDE
jgi:hypothetical protein